MSCNGSSVYRDRGDAVTSHPAISIEKDQQCLRGLRYWFRVDWEYSVDRLVDSLQEAFSGRLLHLKERWGNLHIHILVLQFRFEIRVGGSGHDVDFNHRLTPKETQRERDRKVVFAAIASVLGGSDDA